MRILEHGDVFFFRCTACGCAFQEAAKKTSIAHAGIANTEHPERGYRVRHECPECGNDVIGERKEGRHNHV